MAQFAGLWKRLDGEEDLADARSGQLDPPEAA